MAPDAQPPAHELQRYRAYLRLLVRLLCRDQLLNLIDPSGVVQQTLLETWQKWQQFEQLTEEQKPVWLRTALRNNLRDEIRRMQAQKRDKGRDISLDAGLEQSSARLENYLLSREASPNEHAVRNEKLLLLAEALERLTEERREAVELNRLQGFTLEATAEHMGKSESAVAKLVQRGLADLRKLLDGKVN